MLPARLFGVKEDTGAKIEVLLLKQMEGDTWETLVKPAKRIKKGMKILLEMGFNCCLYRGIRTWRNGFSIFNMKGFFMKCLISLGEMPLPPYIKEQLDDKDRYQTVYAREQGSAAAPTAGLAFYRRISGRNKRNGVHIAFITLHVGLGTFRPVSVDDIDEHEMHSEFYQMTEETASFA